MHCDQANEAMSAALDNELDRSEYSRLVTHCDSCATCTLRFQELTHLNKRLKIELTDSIDADRLWLSISAAMDDLDDANRALSQQHEIRQVDKAIPAVTSDRSLRSRRSFLSAGALTLSGVVAGVTGFSTYRYLRAPTPNVASEAVSDFLTFRAGGMKLNIASADPSFVKRWLTQRVNFDIAIDPSPPPGFSLRGGRLCSFLNRRLVFLYYEDGEAAVSVYLMNQSGLEIPDGDQVQANDRSLTINRANGVSSALWQSNGLIFAAVSDLPVERLVQFVSNV